MLLRGFAFLRLALAALAMTAAVPAAAQFYSDQYKFLKAVDEKKSDEVIEFLNQPGSTLINSRDLSTGESALHIVVKRRDLTWVNFLLGKRANPNIRDKKGVTPLVLATQIGFNEGVQALVDVGAQVDVTNDAGETPLMYAIHRRDTTLMRILLKAGANPDKTDNSGRSAREYAKLAGSALLAELERNEKKAGGDEGPAYGPS